MFTLFNKESKKEIEARLKTDFQEQLNTLVEEVREEARREKDQYEYDFSVEKRDYEREKNDEIKDLVSDHKDELNERDDKIARLENQLDRQQAEYEARIAGLEDEHLNEILAIEAKYNALTETMTQLTGAKQEAVIANAKTHAAEMIAAATKESSVVIAAATTRAAEIEKAAQDRAMQLYAEHTDKIINKAVQAETYGTANVTSIIKSIGEAFPKTIEVNNTNKVQ